MQLCRLYNGYRGNGDKVQGKARQCQESDFRLILRLESDHVLGLRPPRPYFQVKLYRLAFPKCFESLVLDGGVVDENVLPLGLSDESITFGAVEPLYRSIYSSHTAFLTLHQTAKALGICGMLKREEHIGQLLSLLRKVWPA